MEGVNFEALFLGPQAENHEFFKKMLNFLVDEHIHWRRNFHPDDRPCVTLKDQHQDDFTLSLEKVQQVLLQLSSKLKLSSLPWHSPRYVGHMVSDLLIPAQLAYMITLLYNPNNVAWEASPATTEMEIEVGLDLARMVGFPTENAFGHITSGGHVANYEAMWMARNLKSIPFALKQVRPELVQGLDDWQLFHLSTSKILNLLEEAKEVFEEVRKHSIRGKGVFSFPMGKIFVPQSKHYSWVKTVDLLGLGQESLKFVKVKSDYRMDIEDLQSQLELSIKKKEPILAVVGVIGSTEEGAVDEIDKIVALRNKYEKEGLSFFIHADAAYGGYVASIFQEESAHFYSHEELKKKLNELGTISSERVWPSKDVYHAFTSLKEVDSVTIDPHKLGYIPYQAGAVVFKDNRIRNLISYFASYLYEEENEKHNPILLGSFILEGSKAGASAASVWAAHRSVGLHLNGYGKFLSESIEGAYQLYETIQTQQSFEIKNKRYTIIPLTQPDLNIVVYALNEEGNTSLERMNELNRKIRENLSYKGGSILAYDFIVSSTEFSKSDYGENPFHFLNKFGIPKEEWDRVATVFVLRSCIMNPYVSTHFTEENYLEKFLQKLKTILEQIASEIP